MRAPRRQNGGYSLLEVLVAFAIMMMVLTTLLPGQVEMLQRTTTRHEHVLAHELALSLADEFYHHVVTSTLPRAGTFAGRWSWDIATEDQPTQNTNVFLREITITVRNGSDHVLAEVLSSKAVVK